MDLNSKINNLIIQNNRLKVEINSLKQELENNKNNDSELSDNFVKSQLNAMNNQVNSYFNERRTLKEEIEKLKTKIGKLEKVSLDPDLNNNMIFFDILNKNQKLNVMEKQLKPIVNYYNSMNCKLKTLTFECKTSKNNYLINFATGDHLTNLKDQPIVKRKGVEKMDETQLSKTMSISQSVNENMISDKNYHELSVNNMFMPSLNNLKVIRAKLDATIPVKEVWCKDKQIGAFVSFRYAIETAVLLLSRRKHKAIFELKKPIIFRISIDGTLKKSDSIELYILTAFESSDESSPEEANAIPIGVIYTEEKYANIKHYFQEFHDEINQFIANKQTVINEIFNYYFETKVVLCCDYKTLLLFSGLKNVQKKQNCLYCLAEKTDFINFKEYFDSRINTDLYRSVEKHTGIEDPLLIEVDSFLDFSIDTLHLKMRVSEKFFTSCFNSIASTRLYKNTKDFIDECNGVLDNNKIDGQVYLDKQIPTSPKIKISTKGDKDARTKIIGSLIDFFGEKLSAKWEKASEFKPIWQVL